jgi:hypothetical protein
MTCLALARAPEPRTRAAEPRRRPHGAALMALTLWLAGCGLPGDRGQQAAEPAAALPLPLVVEEPVEDERNDDLTRIYAEVEGELTASGRMRRDRAPSDAPYTVDDLVRNFERVALYDEYIDVDGHFVRDETPSYLRRWAVPVRVSVMTSPVTPPEEAARDRANVAAFTRRLARLTGLDMAMAEDQSVNFLVLFMDSDEQAAFAEQVGRRFPEFAPAVLGAIRDSAVDTFCTAYAFSEPGDRAAYAAVVVLIRSEHPPLTRLSCVHEEMAQAMGLPNDSPEARPSLFNDSLEFALLTEHDEILLRMLYDPRLTRGMTVAEAHPLLPDVARDAMQAQLRDATAPAAGASY